MSAKTLSLLGILFSVVASFCLDSVCPEKGDDVQVVFDRRISTLIWLGAAVAIVARLGCRKVAAGKGGRGDRLWLELADPIADPWLIMAAGYCNDWVVKIAGIPVGWVAAVLAVLTALIRILGEALTGRQVRVGPMNCATRLIILAAACLGSIAELWIRQDGKCAQEVMRWTLALIIAGCVVTCMRRIAAMARSIT